MTEHVISVDGTRIGFDRYGDGPGVVLAGGATQHRAIDPSTADVAARLAAAGHAVIHYDRRGRGDSGDTAPFAPEREVEDIAALVDVLGGTAALFGNSSGAAVVLAAAAGVGSAITSVAVYEPPFVVDNSRAPVPGDYLERLTEFGQTDRGAAVEYFMTTAVGMPVEAVAGMREQPFWSVLEGIAPTLAYDAAFVADLMQGRQLPTGRWRDVTMPVLVLTGGASDTWLRTAGEALAAVLPDARHEQLAGQTHAVEAAILAGALIDWFA